MAELQQTENKTHENGEVNSTHTNPRDSRNSHHPNKARKLAIPPLQILDSLQNFRETGISRQTEPN